MFKELETTGPSIRRRCKESYTTTKNGKAADYAGLTSEHLKNATDEVAPSITNIINAIFTKAEIPEGLKTGIFTRTVLKKGKEKTVSTNHTGITVTPLIGKLVEAIIKDRINPILETSQHPLQRGFTESTLTSPLMAALLITEEINECRNNNGSIIIQNGVFILV